MSRKERMNRIEKKAYELVGVKQFRALTFRLERLIHHKDGRQNANYHIGSFEISSLVRFRKYLFYNASIHVRNLLFIAAFFALRALCAKELAWYDVLIAVLGVKDAYCVMLQRYNYLKIVERKNVLESKQRLRVERRAERTSQHLQDYDMSHAEEDLSFVRKLRQSIEGRESYIVRASDQIRLKRLQTLLYGAERGKYEDK